MRAVKVNATCAELQIAEDIAIISYHKEVGFSKERMCAVIDGVEMIIHEKSKSGSWKDDANGLVEGKYFPAEKVMELADGADPGFGHEWNELGHVIERAILGQGGHENWESRGFFRAITRWTAYFWGL